MPGQHLLCISCFCFIAFCCDSLVCCLGLGSTADFSEPAKLPAMSGNECTMRAMKYNCNGNNLARKTKRTSEGTLELWTELRGTVDSGEYALSTRGGGYKYTSKHHKSFSHCVIVEQNTSLKWKMVQVCVQPVSLIHNKCIAAHRGGWAERSVRMLFVF